MQPGCTDSKSTDNEVWRVATPVVGGRSRTPRRDPVFIGQHTSRTVLPCHLPPVRVARRLPIFPARIVSKCAWAAHNHLSSTMKSERKLPPRLLPTLVVLRTRTNPSFSTNRRNGLGRTRRRITRRIDRGPQQPRQDFTGHLQRH